MSNTHTATVRDGDSAVIFYGDGTTVPAMHGTVARVLRTRTGVVRRVGITPQGADVIAWFAPDPDGTEGFVSIGGSTVAYV